MYLIVMNDHQISGGPPHRTQVAQARAWLHIMDRDEAEQWDDHVEIAGLTGDDAWYEELQHAIVGTWRAHRDDPLDPGAAHFGELAQAVAWLDSHTGTWKRAQAISTRTEHETANRLLLAVWRGHRDDTTIPASLGIKIDAIAAAREARLTAAKEWLASSNPTEYYRWDLCRTNADTIEGQWIDDWNIIQRHLAHEHSIPTAPVRETPRKTLVRGIHSWLPWTNNTDHHGHGPRGL